MSYSDERTKYLSLFLVILHFSMDFSSSTKSGNAENPSTKTDASAVKAFVAAFSEAATSSNILTQQFEWLQTNAGNLDKELFRDNKLLLLSWGVDNAEDIAASIAKRVAKQFPAMSLDALIKVYGHAMGAYIASQGILNEANVLTLSKAYTESFEHFDRSTENKYEAIRNGFINFATSLTPMTPERGRKLAQHCEEAILQETDEQCSENLCSNVPNIDPAGNAFVSAFTQEVKSSSVLSELFDMKGNSGEGLGQYIYNDARKNLQSFGVEDAENAAAYATQHLSQDFPVLTFDTLVKVFGNIMARYLSSEGILNEGNSQTLAMEYAKSFEDSANSNMNSQAGSKFIAIGQGFVPFVTSMVQMTPEKGNKIATYFGDAWKLEAASRSV